MFSLNKLVSVKSGYRALSTVSSELVDQFLASNPSTIAIDATWFFPNDPRNAFKEHTQKRLNDKTVFFDIEDISDKSNPFPHMLPSKSQFEQQISKLGITNDSTLLIYDTSDVYSACRASWMFEIFGHDLDKLYILDNFAGYKNYTTKSTDSKSPLPESIYKATFDKSKLVSFEELKQLVLEDKIGKSYTLLDARSGPRFDGSANEARPGISSGHIKNAINVPFQDFLNADKQFIAPEAILNRLKQAGVDESKPIIVMCGSGVTACVVRCGLLLAGFDAKNIAVYDGSWTEWATRAPELVTKSFESNSVLSGGRFFLGETKLLKKSTFRFFGDSYNEPVIPKFLLPSSSLSSFWICDGSSLKTSQLISLSRIPKVPSFLRTGLLGLVAGFKDSGLSSLKRPDLNGSCF
ncbi:hypothetical protein OGAPHI_002843 [Ogataea philodendri]|uniref:Rhodanese domain-containing protein n=1 Tax=Ogataea philodendri TaxID=1378263 RepID=A0A9P8P945_9ASCO|nr:uncharacterized protein OGAPHI_002843 [Ogataea philodendri]KAH3667194.1 hypothetical protein OGAPHI_002843 [Ogataea philodendri]